MSPIKNGIDFINTLEFRFLDYANINVQSKDI